MGGVLLLYSSPGEHFLRVVDYTRDEWVGRREVSGQSISRGRHSLRLPVGLERDLKGKGGSNSNKRRLRPVLHLWVFVEGGGERKFGAALRGKKGRAKNKNHTGKKFFVGTVVFSLERRVPQRGWVHLQEPAVGEWGARKNWA